MYKNGDQVEFVGPYKSPRFEPKIGTIGTVKDFDNRNLMVQWPPGTVRDNGLWWCEKEQVKPRWKDGASFEEILFPNKIQAYLNSPTGRILATMEKDGSIRLTAQGRTLEEKLLYAQKSFDSSVQVVKSLNGSFRFSHCKNVTTCTVAFDNAPPKIGVARCGPDDQFREAIGNPLALARALGLEYDQSYC